MKKILIRIVLLGVAVVALVIVSLFILTEQPNVPTAKVPAPQNRDDAWRQDIGFLRDEFMKLDKSFTPETSSIKVQKKNKSIGEAQIYVLRDSLFFAFLQIQNRGVAA